VSSLDGGQLEGRSEAPTGLGNLTEGGREPLAAQLHPQSPVPERAEGARLTVLADDFRRTVASSILKWVVSHQNYNKSKSKSKEAKHSDPINKKGVQWTQWASMASGVGPSWLTGQGWALPGWGSSSLEEWCQHFGFIS
jgi:hypothetical protein